MWNYHSLHRLDFRTIPILLGLIIMSLLVISATTDLSHIGGANTFLTPFVKNQMQWFAIGTIAYLFFAGIDYHKLRNWSWMIYITTILLLIGLFLTGSIHHVHRWYRIPLLGIMVQPSDYAKLSLVITLSALLEKKGRGAASLETFVHASIIALIPFFLILKQPDLGSALVLFPMTLGMFYFGGVHPKVIKVMSACGIGALFLVTLIFLEVVPHQEIKKVATTVLKEYQFARFDPNTYHHHAAQTAIALGGYTGSGWKQSQFTGRDFLPAGHTDSVFPAFTEEFGLIGAFFMLLLFFGLIYCSFQVTAVARDHFGRVLSAGITMYLVVHVVINIGMMCGFLPITGVPLLLISYGGSSVLSTMSALGILQSVYTRRFMF